MAAPSLSGCGTGGLRRPSRPGKRANPDRFCPRPTPPPVPLSAPGRGTGGGVGSPEDEAMLPEMTPAVERALGAAREWAGRLGQAAVGPAHVLAGLLEEEEGRATTLLLAAGVDV